MSILFFYFAVITVIYVAHGAKVEDHVYTYDQSFNPAAIPADATKVIFKNFQINTIPSRSFSHLSNCLKMEFDNTAITTIQEDTWKGLEKLYSFHLANNGPTTLSAKMFKNLNSLETVILEGNDITAIETGAWNGVQNTLRVLKFWRNSLCKRILLGTR